MVGLEQNAQKHKRSLGHAARCGSSQVARASTQRLPRRRGLRNQQFGFDGAKAAHCPKLLKYATLLVSQASGWLKA